MVTNIDEICNHSQHFVHVHEGSHWFTELGFQHKLGLGTTCNMMFKLSNCFKLQLDVSSNSCPNMLAERSYQFFILETLVSHLKVVPGNSVGNWELVAHNKFDNLSNDMLAKS